MEKTTLFLLGKSGDELGFTRQFSQGEKGRIIPELKRQNVEKFREIIIKPCRLFYRIEQDTVYIMAVIDGLRNIGNILLSRNLR